MRARLNWGGLLGALFALWGLALPWAGNEAEGALSLLEIAPAAWAWWSVLGLALAALLLSFGRASKWAGAGLLLCGVAGSLIALLGFKEAIGAGFAEPAGTGFWLSFWGCLLAGGGAVTQLSTLSATDRLTRVLRDYLPPASVPAALFLSWEAITEGLRVPLAFFPRVSDVYAVLLSSSGVLVEDSIRTFVMQVLLGYGMGITAGVVMGVLVAFSRFMQRGFLPLATAFSAIPIVGLAPVLGRAFGVDWESKAAVAVIVSFFPVLVNVVQGLTVIDPLKLDLMQSYAAKPRHVLRMLRFPNALPYVFNALKIASIIVFISVIVAEFLIPGPPQGLGQRISLSARSGRYDVTFAAIAYASLLGILFYNAIALLERLFTSWHSSFREK